MKNLQKHFLHYIVYLIIFGVGLFFILSVRGNSTLQAQLIITIASLYFIWAMIHHYVHHELQSRIVIEYILIVALGTVLVLFLFGV